MNTKVSKAGWAAAGFAFAVLLATTRPAPAEHSTVTLIGPGGGKYQAVLTQRTLQAKTSTTPQITQSTVAIYRVTLGGREKVWIAPSSVVPKVHRVSNYPMGWQPLMLLVSSLSAASLVPGQGQQLVFSVHESSADCGTASVHVIGLGVGTAHELASVQNFCDLTFTVAKDHLVLKGPAYKSSDPLCCPSMPKAQATLSSVDGGWKLTPNYYKLSVPPPKS
jgi:hypothetical protein